MDMIGNAANPEAFTVCVSGDGGQISVEIGAYRHVEHRGAVFGAEDEVNEEEGERLRHGKRIDRV